jgi:hypothetical protein
MIMRVKAYLEKGFYELFDENGMFLMKLRTQRQLRVYCKRNDLKLEGIFEVVKTESL